MKFSMLPRAAAFTCALAGLSAAHATTYHLVDLGAGTQAFAINARGEIAGTAPDGHAARYADGTWTHMSVLESRSWATGIDADGDMSGEEVDAGGNGYPVFFAHDSKDPPLAVPLPNGSASSFWQDESPGMSPDGRVVGTYVDASQDGAVRCFVWQRGDAAATDIGLPANGKFDTCEAYAVNGHGTIVGRLRSADAGIVAFSYKDGVFNILSPYAWGYQGAALAVNGKGDAAGYLASPDWGRPELWVRHQAVNIPDGETNMDEALAINKDGVIVGTGYAEDTDKPRMVIYAGGAVQDLAPMVDDLSGWHVTSDTRPTGIADDGTIIGNGLVSRGKSHAFMLVPDAQ